MKLKAVYVFIHTDHPRTWPTEIELQGEGENRPEAEDAIRAKVNRLIRGEEVDGYRVENVGHYNLVGKMREIR